MLGAKKFGGNEVYPNDILVRQRGWKWRPGINTLTGRDNTIISKIEGVVKYTKSFSYIKKQLRKQTTVHVLPSIQGPNINQYPQVYQFHPELYPELAKYNMEYTNFPIKEKIRSKSVS